MCVSTGGSGLSLTGFNLKDVAPLSGQRWVLELKTIFHDQVIMEWGGLAADCGDCMQPSRFWKNSSEAAEEIDRLRLGGGSTR